MSNFTHLDAHGNARMVDITSKPVTVRTAVASATIRVNGPVPIDEQLSVTIRTATIMATHRTPMLIPLCHSIHVDDVDVFLAAREGAIELEVSVVSTDRTGVEMEALTGAATAALCVVKHAYDNDVDAVIEDVAILRKTGGKSGDWGRNVSSRVR